MFSLACAHGGTVLKVNVGVINNVVPQTLDQFWQMPISWPLPDQTRWFYGAKHGSSRGQGGESTWSNRNCVCSPAEAYQACAAACSPHQRSSATTKKTLSWKQTSTKKGAESRLLQIGPLARHGLSRFCQHVVFVGPPEVCSQHRLLTTHLLAGSVSNIASTANGAVSVKHPTILAINTAKSSEFDLTATVLSEPRYCCDSSHGNPSNVKRMSKSLVWSAVLYYLGQSGSLKDSKCSVWRCCQAASPGTRLAYMLTQGENFGLLWLLGIVELFVLLIDANSRFTRSDFWICKFILKP